MRRRRVVLAAVVLLVAAGAAAVVFDPAARVRGWAGGEPFYRGKAATAWRKELRQPDGTRPTEAADALAGGGTAAVPVCAWVLRSAPEPEARWRAADALARMGAPARPAAPDLVAALADADPLVRGVAVRAVGELAPDVPGGVEALVALFPNVEAIRAAARFGPAGAGAVAALTGLLKHADPTVRWQAGRALGKVGPPALPALPELVRQAASDPDPLVREHAVEAIGDIGPAAAAGIPALVAALKDPVARVRRDAVRSLGQMGTSAKAVLADVRATARDPDPDVRAAATRAARLIDPAGEKE